MNVKLTLTLDKEIIERAKRYAKNKNQSLSSLVQGYFNFLSERKRLNDIEISQNVKELSGIIKLKKDINISEEYKKHILEKYI